MLYDSINVIFDCQVEHTDRVDLVFDVFGLNIDKYKHVIIDDLILPEDWDVLFITGVSGSGKSVLLRSLAEVLNVDMISYGAFSKRMRKSNKSIIESIGNNFENALTLLNISGLSEAFIYLKKFRELSEGQKYRFYLAKLLETDTEVIIVDEFVTALDRVTAKSVAFNYQKSIRRRDKRLIVATAHDDLIQELRPSHIISFTYSGEHVVRKMHYEGKHIPPFLDEIEMRHISPRSKDMYLLKYHYKNTRLPAMLIDAAGFYHRNNIVALALTSIPMRTFSLDRFWMTEEEKDIWGTLNANERRLVSGNNVGYICREVVHPMFRGIGLAAHMFKEYIPKVQKRLVLASGVMLNYTGFQEQAGMSHVLPKGSNKFEKLSNFFSSNGIDQNKVYYDEQYRNEVLGRIEDNKKTFGEFMGLIELYTKKHFGDIDEKVDKSDMSLELLEKYLLKLRPARVKTYYAINKHVPIDFTSVFKFRSKLLPKKTKRVRLK